MCRLCRPCFATHTPCIHRRKNMTVWSETHLIGAIVGVDEKWAPPRGQGLAVYAIAMVLRRDEGLVGHYIHHRLVLASGEPRAHIKQCMTTQSIWKEISKYLQQQQCLCAARVQGSQWSLRPLKASWNFLSMSGPDLLSWHWCPCNYTDSVVAYICCSTPAHSGLKAATKLN